MLKIPLLVVLVSSQVSVEDPKEVLNVKLTNAAWVHFNAKRYAKAIVAADKCIETFYAVAKSTNAELVKKKAAKAPRGKVVEGSKRFEEVASRGPLNDTATCLWIKARSWEELGKTKDAKEAYSKAAGLSYAACWDPKGWFWSPPEDAVAAAKRLRRLK